MSLIGLDIGTTSCKALVFAPEGRVLAAASREYGVAAPRAGWAEQDAEQVWRLAWDAVREAAASAGDADPPIALALSVQGEAVIPVDATGAALRPAILGMDTRTEPQNDWLRQHLGAEWLYTRTGMPVHTINTLPKLLWLKAHEPDVWRQAHRFLLYEDYVLSRLGGCAAISHCLASRTQLYDLRAGVWCSDILDVCGIDQARLGTLAAPFGGRVGTLSPSLASELGLSGELALVAGGHDQACAALGSGVISPGQAMVSTGSAEVVEVALATPILSEPLRQGNVSVYRHVVPGRYLAMTLNHSGGLVLRWYRDTVARPERDMAIAAGSDPYETLFGELSADPSGLLVLPHMAGSGTPWMDTQSKGAVLGLTLGTSKEELAQALLEGLTYELRSNLELLRQGGIGVEALHAVGGGARNETWLQLKADICGVPLHVPRVTEAACLGAALLAGVAVGAYADLGSAVTQTVRLDRRIDPDPTRQAAYERPYALFRDLYPTLKDLLHRI